MSVDAGPSKALACVATHSTGYSDYVLHLARSSAAYIFATSDPVKGIVALDPSSFKPTARVSSGRTGITQLGCHRVDGKETLLASNAQGASVWDLRTGAEPAIQLSGPNNIPVLCFDVAQDGHSLALGTELRGTDAFLDIRDLRYPDRPVIRFSEAHSDDITSVTFVSSSPTPLVLSSSTSGLLALHDPTIQDEDDAFLHATDVGASVARAGTFPCSPRTGVWARTDMDTLTGYDLVDGLTPVDEWVWGSAKAEAVNRPDPSWAEPLDYVISVESVSDGKLAYLAGTQTGDVALMGLDDPRPRQVLATLRSGHFDIVRCAHLDPSSGTIVTGGEDGRVCLWSSAALTPSPSRNGKDVGTETRPRFRPY